MVLGSSWSWHLQLILLSSGCTVRPRLLLTLLGTWVSTRTPEYVGSSSDSCVVSISSYIHDFNFSQVVLCLEPIAPLTCLCFDDLSLPFNLPAVGAPNPPAVESVLAWVAAFAHEAAIIEEKKFFESSIGPSGESNTGMSWFAGRGRPLHGPGVGDGGSSTSLLAGVNSFRVTFMVYRRSARSLDVARIGVLVMVWESSWVLDEKLDRADNWRVTGLFKRCF